MFRTILFLFGLTFVAGMPHDEKKQDDDFLHCCENSIEGPFQGFHNDIKECFRVHRNHTESKPHRISCEIDICIANKQGFALSDGTIDKKALEKRIEKDFENDQDLADAIKENCVNGDISKYGDEGYCDLIKVRQCMAVQTILNCQHWKDEDDCSKIMAAAQEFVKEIQ